jgi:hypothetical protein
VGASSGRVAMAARRDAPEGPRPAGGQGGARRGHAGGLGRRELLGGSLSAAAWLALSGLPRLAWADVVPEPGGVSAQELAPLLRWLEQTPRERLLEELGARVRGGLSYRALLGALLLAGVRGVEPRPVGFRFHAVLAIHAAHQASLAAPPEERWLPLFWSADLYKSAQAEQRALGDWQLPAEPDPAAVPDAERAPAAFREAMVRWDAQAADGAALALARHASAQQAFELFAQVAPRDFRDIGHKVIYLAGAFRLLEVIGWQHAAPVLRSLALALNQHGGDPSPVGSEQAADRDGRENRERLGAIPAGWQQGTDEPGAPRELLRALRTASGPQASAQLVELLRAGVGPRSLWDGLSAAAGELAMRRGSLVALHSLTALNALRYSFERSASDETRRFTLLQAGAFLPAFRGAPSAGVELDALEPAAQPVSAAEIFAELGRDKLAASRQLLAYRAAGGPAQPLLAAARALVRARGRGAHDYKYSSAVLEDCERVSPAWRDRYLAAALHALVAEGSPPNELVPRIEAALRG